jgi:glycerophosphoryl diester phosphodiesterase
VFAFELAEFLMSNFLSIGHRGARGHEPENTLRSVRRALELGADGIEIDVFCVEEQVVVIHDETLERTTNGRGVVTQQSFEYLRSLDAGAGEKIPTLEEVLDEVDRRAFVNIELKALGSAGPVVEVVDRYIEQRGWNASDFIISSFDHDELRAVPGEQLRIGLLFERPSSAYAALARELRAYSVHVELRHTTRDFVANAHSNGLKVFVYTVNAIADIERMRTWGVDGVFTDFPERVNK